MSNFFKMCAVIIFFCCANFANAQLQKMTLMLDWQINPDHAPLWIAEHEGFFQKQGIDVDLIVPSDPTDPPRFAAANKVDFALTYEPGWILLQKQGVPLSWVATIVGQPLVCIVTKPDIKQLKQLEGRSVGYTGGAFESIMLRSMMLYAHTDPDRVHWLNIHYDTLQAFAANRVDALTGLMRNIEPIALASKNIPFNKFLPENYGFPSYAEMIIVANSKMQQDPRMKAFQIALKEATAYIKAHPEASWQSFAKGNPALNNEMNHKMWLKTIPYLDSNPAAFDAKQYDGIKAFLEKTLLTHHKE